MQVLDCLFCFIRCNRLKFLNYDVLLPLKIDIILVNSADPGEMPNYVAFLLGLHCLPKYLFADIQNEMIIKVLKMVLNILISVLN